MLLSEEAISEVNTEPNMSEKHVEQPERPRRTGGYGEEAGEDAAVEVMAACTVAEEEAMAGGGFGGGRAVLVEVAAEAAAVAAGNRGRDSRDKEAEEEREGNILLFRFLLTFFIVISIYTINA